MEETSIIKPIEQKHSEKIIGLILVIALLLIASVYLGFQNMQLQKEIAGMKVVSSPTPTASTDPTASWKTYKDINGQFEFKYPPNYSLDTTHRNPYLNRKITWEFDNTSLLDCRGDCPVVTSKDDKIIANTHSTKLEGYVGAVGGNIPQSYIRYEIPTNVKFFSMTLNELPLDLTATEASQYGPDRQYQTINKDEENIFDQILSTFQFTSSTSQTDTSNWKTYTNTKVGFSINYPPKYPNPGLPSGLATEPTIYANESSDSTDIIFGTSSNDYFDINLFPFSGNLTDLIDATNSCQILYKSKCPQGMESGGHITASMTKVKDVNVNKTSGSLFSNFGWIFFLVNKNHAFIMQISPNYQSNDVDALLSTFKFTQ